MLRFVVLFLLLLVSLYGQSDKELLSRANTYAKSSSKTDQFRAYNDYKNLYLRALMNDDNKIKKFALEGIVSSGNKLHIDVTDYARELLHMKSSYTPPKPKKVQTKKNKNIKIKSSHKLKAVRWKDGRLILKFDKKLRNNQINYFTLYDSKTKKYKYVFDIHASMLTKSQRLQKSGIDSIKLAQYNSYTLRLVIAHSKKLSIHFKKDGSILYIRMAKSYCKPNKTVKKAKKSQEKIYVRPRKNKVIVIDPGHGGKDPGAIGYRHYREKMVVLQIAKELKKILKSRGYKVYMTRDRDKFIKLRHRTKFANDKGADIFVSIHANAVSRKNAKKAQGIESYFLSTTRSSRAKKVAELENSADLEDMNFYGKECFLNTINSHNIIAANKLAIDLQRGALASLKKRYKNVKDAGVREGPFWVLVGAQMPSVLVEVGFITHPTEARRLANREYQKTMAKGLANGIERYFMHN
ncbi:N-acetylmuramoyl-L-alanine amidase family protein [Sulfurimonas paralvinellae]|uniref:N-acetylmuramoyl-L-alanine amidase n=1 Tax=Sulfurimonas paralvinellae TaxID=317658 RepID=A0A7M1B926_9BACT|nr:N-acetylmuramoyl-L-alanine amidase [Sulfurimonas paralvinellae]QOP45318.1 N-acetylmuramoyl-L-alanine amidase [Sulfurimonas paralvinellae]